MGKTGRGTLGPAIGVLILVFSSGLLVGRVTFRNPSPPSPTTNLMSGIVNQLDLDETQRERFNEILTRRGDFTNERLRSAIEFLRVQTDSASEEIRRLLSDSQIVAFDSLLRVERSQMRMRTPAPPGLGNRNPPQR